MKKIFLISSTLLLASTFASAETINAPGARMEVNDNGIDIISALGQALSLSPGKAVINTNNPEIPNLSQEVVDENTIRIGLGDDFMDVQVDDRDNPGKVRLLGPDGKVLRILSKKIDANGRETMEIRDETNNVTGYSITNADGTKIAEVDEDFGNGNRLYMKKENGVVVRGHADISSKNYKKKIGFGSQGMEIVIKDNNNKLLYRGVGNSDSGRIYDGSGNLIAEGSDNDRRIYNQAAYDEFKKIMENND